MPSNGKKSNDNYRKHITAAKEWLGQAEESIDEENNIRSDLNLMLAQAELQRAKEKDDIKLWRKWMKWTVPWIAALAIAAGYILLLRPETETTESVNTANVATPAATKELDSDQPSDSAVEMAPQEIMSSDNSHEVLQTEPLQIHEEIPQKRLTQNSEKLSVAEEQPIQPQSNPLPMEDMHKLMQSAGKSLRE